MMRMIHQDGRLPRRRHSYTLEQFDLAPGEEEERFAFYRDRFGVARELFR